MLKCEIRKTRIFQRHISYSEILQGHCRNLKRLHVPNYLRSFLANDGYSIFREWVAKWSGTKICHGMEEFSSQTTQPSEVWSSSCLSLIQHRFVPHRWNGLNHNEMSGIFILPHAATETERHKCIIFDFPHLEANQRRSTPSRVSRPEAMSLWHTDRHRRL